MLESPTAAPPSRPLLGDRPRLNRFTTRLGVFALLNLFLVNGLLLWLGPRPAETVFDHLARFARGEQGRDSWRPMALAYHYAHAHPSEPLYEGLFFGRRVKFVYPPSALLLFDLSARLDPGGAAEAQQMPASAREAYAGWLQVFNAFSRLFVGLTAVLAAAILDWSRRRFLSPSPALLERGVLALLAFATALSFYPLLKSYTLGQIQPWLSALFALATLLWIKERKGLAGAALGLMCLVKPNWLAFLPWAAIRKEWRLGVAALTVAGIGTAVSVGVYGVADHVDYLRVASHLTQHGEAFRANQSVNGLLHRLLGNGNSVDFSHDEYPPYNRWVHGGTVVSSLLVLLLAWWPARQPGKDGRTVSFLLMGLAATLASPLVWDHYYAVLLPIFAVVAPLAAGVRPFGRLTFPALGTSFVLASNYVSATEHWVMSPLNLVQSPLLFAAILVGALLVRLRSGKEAHDRAADSAP